MGEGVAKVIKEPSNFQMLIIISPNTEGVITLVAGKANTRGSVLSVHFWHHTS